MNWTARLQRAILSRLERSAGVSSSSRTWSTATYGWRSDKHSCQHTAGDQTNTAVKLRLESRQTQLSTCGLKSDTAVNVGLEIRQTHTAATYGWRSGKQSCQRTAGDKTNSCQRSTGDQTNTAVNIRLEIRQTQLSTYGWKQDSTQSTYGRRSDKHSSAVNARQRRLPHPTGDQTTESHGHPCGCGGPAEDPQVVTDCTLSAPAAVSVCLRTTSIMLSTIW